jgi:hypothetical protein
MMIFDEEHYAINLLTNGTHGNYIKWHDLLILSKYFRFKNKKESEIREELINFCIRNNSEFNEIVFERSIDSAITKSEKQYLKLGHPVVINKSEIEAIRTLNDYKYEKILFTMLVISRFYKTSNHSCSSNYYINYNFATILPMAKVYVSKSERDYIKHYFFEKKMIEAVPPNTRYYINGRDNFKILYANDNSGSYVSVPDPYESAYFYPIFCENCGREISKNFHQKHNLCDNCRKEKVRIDTLNRVKLFRNGM